MGTSFYMVKPAYRFLISDYDRYPLRWEDIFPGNRSRILEIGFGNGEFLIHYAEGHPDKDFLGVESSWLSVKKGLKRLALHSLDNVRIFYGNASWVLKYVFPCDSFQEIWMLFPDPWPKKRHVCHRLGSGDFVKHAYRVMQPGGRWTVVTDDRKFMEWLLSRVKEPYFRHNLETYHGVPKFFTKYEKRWLDQGQSIIVCTFVKVEIDSLEPKEPEQGTVKIYKFHDPFDPRSIQWDLRYHEGDLTVVVKNSFWDGSKEIGLFQVVIREGDLVQKLFIELKHQRSEWVLTPSNGCFYMPTEGVQKALDVIYQRICDRDVEST